MQIIQGIHFKTNQPITVVVDGGIIKSVVPAEDSRNSVLPIIAPGLIDLQINGLNGIDFNDESLKSNGVEDLTLSLLTQGVTAYYPTVITNSTERIKSSLSVINSACKASRLVNNCVGGIHLEGPFISNQAGPLGAHNSQYVQAPDWGLFNEFYEASDGRIKIVTLSPEWDNAAAFTKQCVQLGIVVSIGHTAANGNQIARVVDAGATMSTHLGNGAHQLLPRHPNYIWDQLADDKLAASFIGDGFHLPASVIKVILKVKANKAILVSDSVSLAGMQPGNYETPIGGKVTLTADGQLHLLNSPGILAGSAKTLLQAANNLLQCNLSNVVGIIGLASSNPARLLSLPQKNGLIEGAPADLVLFYKQDSQLSVSQTYKNGVLVYDAETIKSSAL